MQRRLPPAPAPRRPWLPLAMDAVVAFTPGTSLVTALGLAGGGYLVGRESVAACGAVVGAFGLAVERFQSRGIRRRLRRERADYRVELRGLSAQFGDFQRDLNGLRADLETVRQERDAVRDDLRQALAGLPDRKRTIPAVVGSPLASATAAPVVAAPMVAVPVVADPMVAAPVAAERVGVVPEPRTAPGLPLAGLLPGQLRSPLATGGIPLLEPGPRMPVPKVIDLRASDTSGLLLGASVEPPPVSGTIGGTGLLVVRRGKHAA